MCASCGFALARLLRCIRFGDAHLKVDEHYPIAAMLIF